MRASRQTERRTAAHLDWRLACLGQRDLSIGGGERDLQFSGRGFQSHFPSGESYGCSHHKVLLYLARPETIFAKFNSMVAGSNGRQGECAIRLHCAGVHLIDENRRSNWASLDVQRRHVRHWKKAEYEPTLLTLANAYLL